MSYSRQRPLPRHRAPAEKKGSGSGGTTVGMAIAMFLCLPAGVTAAIALYMLHGYGVI